MGESVSIGSTSAALRSGRRPTRAGRAAVFLGEMLRLRVCKRDRTAFRGKTIHRYTSPDLPDLPDFSDHLTFQTHLTFLNSQLLLEMPHPIARYAELGFAVVLQPHEDTAAPRLVWGALRMSKGVDARVQFTDEGHVDDRGTVDA